MPLTILTYPDPRLKEKAKEIGEITPELKQLATDMAEAMYAAAAKQPGADAGQAQQSGPRPTEGTMDADFTVVDDDDKTKNN